MTLESVRPVVLAAGKGTRMRSDLPKALHRLAGRPLLMHLITALEAAGYGRPIVVIGHGGELVQELLLDRADFVWQEQQHGTGHAVGVALKAYPMLKRALIVHGDLPLLRADSLMRLGESSEGAGALLTARMDDPKGFGRIVRDETGKFVRIVEEADATPEERAIDEVNVGAYLLDIGLLRTHLAAVGRGNAQGEVYFVDAVSSLAKEPGLDALEIPAADSYQVNDRAQLAVAGAQIRRREVERLMAEGVTVIDPSTTYVDAGVQVGKDSVIHPFTFLEGETSLGEGCEIGPQTRLLDSRLGDGCHVEFSVLEETILGDGTSVGPFSHLRPGTETGRQVSIGNFVEVKAVRIGDQSKVRHHSYLGNAELGRRVNIGAGTVIVNYDGQRKHFTRVADEAFVGCNSNLVSPVEIGKGAYVAAGSTVTQEVPEGSLAVARERQRNILGWVSRRRSQEG